MRRPVTRWAPDPRARWIWLFAIVVSGALAWLLEHRASRAGPAEPDAPPAVEEVDVVWVPEAEPPGAAVAEPGRATPDAPDR